MNNRIFIFIFFLSVVTSQRSLAQIDSATKAKEIINLEQCLANALTVDTIVWSKYLDKNWHIVDDDGSVSSKQEFLQTFKPFPKEISISVKVTRPVFSFHENIAVIQYVADEHETAYGQQLHTTYGTMDVWYKKGQSWLMLSMQDFEIPALPPTITTNQAIIRPYIGTYQLLEGKTAIIFLKNDTLFIQKGAGKPVALFAETANVFFRKEDARGRKIFVTAADGNMVMLERRNGQDLVWKKIK